MMVMSHQYLVFDEIPELAAWSREAGRKLPLLRDVDSSYYLRQEKIRHEPRPLRAQLPRPLG